MVGRSIADIDDCVKYERLDRIYWLWTSLPYYTYIILYGECATGEPFERVMYLAAPNSHFVGESCKS